MFVVELGERLTAEMERINRLKQTSFNTGIGEAERMLFDKLLKAKLTAVVEAADKSASASSLNKNKLFLPR